MTKYINVAECQKCDLFTCLEESAGKVKTYTPEDARLYSKVFCVAVEQNRFVCGYCRISFYKKQKMLVPIRENAAAPNNTVQNPVAVQSRSRHCNQKTYTCFIDYTSERNGVSGICRYCCDCANGKRTVGCCSHVAAIIYYLSHARYLSRIINPAEILIKMFKTTGFVGVQEDSDTDEDETVTTLSE
ncbi:hypothetical protein ABEB36_014452 [Hypothenemus hampei]|uniref:SWIM-type domain-containing protein n=1 Tax=Hypothenemus hampei TaxID=57062 RepID=A0ABD1E1V3_HYPHA